MRMTAWAAISQPGSLLGVSAVIGKTLKGTELNILGGHHTQGSLWGLPSIPPIMRVSIDKDLSALEINLKAVDDLLSNYCEVRAHQVKPRTYCNQESCTRVSYAFTCCVHWSWPTGQTQHHQPVAQAATALLV